MGTDFLGNGIDGFVVTEVSDLEDGYYYYGYIHRSGKVLIMRENQTGTEYRYADGGHNPFDEVWALRDTLDYKRWDLV